MNRRTASAVQVTRTVGLALALAAPSVACTHGAYSIGALCPPADAGAAVDPRCASPTGATLAVDLSTSGVSGLGASLDLPAGPLAPAFRLRGEHATTTAWTDDVAGALTSGAGAPTPSLAAPFTDTTLAVELAAAAPSYVAPSAAFGAVGVDDLVVEVVLRAAAGATLVDKRAGGVGWSLAADATGVLALALQGPGATAPTLISSPPLVEDAWVHCLFWASRAAGGLAQCDGDGGAIVPLGTVGNLDAPTTATFGGGARARVALLALYHVAAGGLGAATTWPAVGSRRFAALTGVLPQLARGTALPKPGLRASPAYVDIDRDGLDRPMFLVGPDWPRIACRLGRTAALPACGYLSETARARVVPPSPTAWQPSEVAVAADATPLADGAAGFGLLVPSTATAPHVLSMTGAFGKSHQVLSVFVHGVGASATHGRLGLVVGTAPMAVFDLRTGAVSVAPAGVTATMEPWADGLYRCAVAVDAPEGPVTYALHLFNPLGVESFAGDGVTGTIAVAGLQVDVAQAYPGSLLAADAQPADTLTYVGDDGNLPAGATGSLDLRVLVPAGVLPTDQAVLNLNRGGSFTDQVQLYVAGNTDVLTFWGLSAGATLWTVNHPMSVIDGTAHTIHAAWNAASATVLVDGVSATVPALAAAPQTYGLDRVDVGFSKNSSGALDGLVGSLQISGQ